MHVSHPLHEGYVGLRSGQVSWLPGCLPSAPSQVTVGSPVAALARAAGVPGHSGGSAPDSHRLPSPPTLSAEIVPPGARGLDSKAVTVNLTRIYTRLGDGGETHLGDMSRVPKTHPRIEAYGTVDELNAQLGLALTASELPVEYAHWLRHVQNDLFDLGADISVPAAQDAERERLRVTPDQTEWLEQRCDEVNETLPKLRSFLLPVGNAAAAQLHVCRTVCRRAERRAIDVGDELNPEVVRYLNRLSDLLFILARGANRGEEPLWEPGAGRE